MHVFKQRLTLLTLGLAIAALTLAAPTTASATVFTLSDNGQEAHFNPGDQNNHGLVSWSIGNNEFLYNQQYFLRLGQQPNGPQPFNNNSIDGGYEEPLGNYFKNAKQPKDNLLKAKYNIPAGNFNNNGPTTESVNENGNNLITGLKANAFYRLDAVDSQNSRIQEALAVTSKTYSGPIDLFVYTDFDVTGRLKDKGSASRKGGIVRDGDYFAKYSKLRAFLFGEVMNNDNPLNTAGLSSDSIARFKKKADRYEISQWPAILDRLTDEQADDLANSMGKATFGPGDVSFAHQFSFDIEPNQTLLITGTKSAAVPTPSAFVGGIALLGGLAMRRRRRNRSAA